VIELIRSNYIKAIIGFSLIIVLLLLFNAIYFGYINHSSIVRADQWRFIELYLYPIYNNSFEFKMLWSDHHSNPLTAILFILSDKYFNLTVNMYFYVGIVGKILFIVLFIYLVNRSLKNTSLLVKALVTVLIVSTYLSLKSVNEYAWPLVTLGNIWILILSIALYYFDNLYKEKNMRIYFLVFFIFTFSFIFTKDLAIIYTASIVGILLLIFFRDREYKKVFNLIILIVLSFIMYKLFYLYVGIEQKYSSAILFDINSFNIIGALKSYSIALLSGIFQIQFLKSIGINNATILYIGYFILLLYIAVIICYVKFKLYNISIVPIVLMLFGLLFATAVILFRFYPSTDTVSLGVASSRYTKLYEIGIISMFWSISIIFDNKSFNNFVKFLLFIMIMFLILINFYTIKTSWNFSKYVVNTNKKAEKLLYDYSFGNKDSIPKFIKGAYFSKDKVIFLKNNNLNVFNDNYRSNQL